MLFGLSYMDKFGLGYKDPETGFDKRAFAHLGGKATMKKFVSSIGEYNPEDEFGSSFREYYEKSSG